MDNHEDAGMPMYLPLHDLTPGSTDNLAAGALAYIPEHKEWVLSVYVSAEHRQLISLTGSDPLSYYDADVFHDTTALVLREWRLLVDLDGSIDGRFQRIEKGQAFRHGDTLGIGAKRPSERSFDGAIYINIDGSPFRKPSNEAIAFFPSWRIVTGDQRDPYVICKMAPGMASA